MSTPSRSSRSRGMWVLVALICAAPFVAADQQQQLPPPSPPPQPSSPPPQSSIPQFKGGINFVRVDVFATTRDGVPVQDLTQADFDVREDGAPQKIETFEHIVVEPGQPERSDPSSITRANQLAADPRRRVFVIYLDTKHVSVMGSHAIKEPLIELLTKILGPDDLVGVMTPEMAADQIAFGRKTQVIEEGLRKNWTWGQRESIMYDEQEQKYMVCFPPMPGEADPSALAMELILRRRERMVLDSLRDLILHMGAIREGRTAVVAVSDGWRLYAPSEALTRPRKDPASGMNADPLPGTPPPIGVGAGGTLTTRDGNHPYGNYRTECDADRMELAMADDAKIFRDLFGDANRANVSFYPVDPRGLPVFDSPIGPQPPPPITVDRAILTARTDSLRVLAANTDGIAMVENNDLRKQMHRLADDLTSYYLIGYSSTNARLDGGYRKIKVSAKRPGIQVRARDGYRAASAKELSTAQAKSATPRPNAAVSAALGTLARDTRVAPAEGGSASRRVQPTDVPGEPVFFRRGPLTANQQQRASGKEFSRTDRLHIEMMPGEASAWSGALLDRNGKTLPIPVPTGERTDAATGQRWLTADLVLAPLGAGEYVIELTVRRGTEDQKIMKAIRVTQ